MYIPKCEQMDFMCIIYQPVDVVKFEFFIKTYL